MNRREEIYVLRRTLDETIKIWKTFESIAIALDDDKRCVLMESQIAKLSIDERLETFIAFFNAHAAMGRGLLFATEITMNAVPEQYLERTPVQGVFRQPARRDPHVDSPGSTDVSVEANQHKFKYVSALMIAACDRLGADYIAWSVEHDDEHKECTLYDDEIELPTTFELPFFNELRWPKVQA